jgi:hypothetical protein
MGGLFGGGAKNTEEAKVAGLQVQTSAYGAVIPLVYGRNRVAPNLIYYTDFTAISHTETQSSGGKGGRSPTNTTYTYTAAMIFGLCEGQINGVLTAFVDKENKLPSEFGLTVFTGSMSQTPWGYAQTYHPSEALAYHGIAGLQAEAYDLGNSAGLPNHNFEVEGLFAIGGGIADANPADIVLDFLTNPKHGAGYPADKIIDLSDYRDYCTAAGLFLSPAMTEAKPAQEWLKQIAEVTNSMLIYGAYGLRIKPRGDRILSANSVTWLPNNPVRFDLNDADFIASLGEDPIKVKRKTQSDAFNRVQVEFTNREFQYNSEVVEAKDQVNIEIYGLRPSDAKKMLGVCDKSVATKVAYQQLQRALYIRASYSFKLSWAFSQLEAGDIVSLNDAGIGLNAVPVLITAITEDHEGLLSIEAEELPPDISTVLDYSGQANSGYISDYGYTPPSVNPPFIFNAPTGLTNDALEVWCAVSGAGAHWGGCQIWASYDDATYERIGEINTPARHGLSTSTLTTGSSSLSVQLFTSPALLSATPEQADNLATLCMVGNELIAYEGATLTAPNAYTLDHLRRGAKGTLQDAFPIGTPFTRVGADVFKYGFDAENLGKTLYLKFLSFNEYNKSSQSLDTVSPYSHILGKNSSLSGASTGGGLLAPFLGTYFDAQWLAVKNIYYYRVRIYAGVVLKREFQCAVNTFRYTHEDAVTDGGAARSYTIEVTPFGPISYGVGYGTTSSFNASNGAPAAITGIAYLTGVLSWDANSETDFAGYIVRISTSSGFDPSAGGGSQIYTGTANSTTPAGLTPATTYFVRVAAYDVWENTQSDLDWGSEFSFTA